MALAIREVINVEVVQHSADLTDYAIFPKIAKDADFIGEYFRYFDMGFEEMEGPLKIYAIKAFIYHLTSRVCPRRFWNVHDELYFSVL